MQKSLSGSMQHEKPTLPSPAEHQYGPLKLVMTVTVRYSTHPTIEERLMLPSMRKAFGPFASGQLKDCQAALHIIMYP